MEITDNILRIKDIGMCNRCNRVLAHFYIFFSFSNYYILFNYIFLVTLVTKYINRYKSISWECNRQLQKCNRQLHEKIFPKTLDKPELMYYLCGMNHTRDGLMATTLDS